MSGFSTQWLALREPADHRARHDAVQAACAERFSGQGTLDVIDFGCGTGSNLRALAACLPARQNWRLVDFDPELLTAARSALCLWADSHEDMGEHLRLHKHGKLLAVQFCQADLMVDLEPLLAHADGLVTAAALFDLCSPSWIARFVKALAARNLPLLAVLTYNGEEAWSPAHCSDAAMLKAFIAHQHRDKGFGPASGPYAPDLLMQALGAHGYSFVQGASPWRLGAGEAGLIRALAEGSAQAVLETGRLPVAEILRWQAARAAATTCKIGHTDLFATPAQSR